jgi:hypothetical protein
MAVIQEQAGKEDCNERCQSGEQRVRVWSHGCAYVRGKGGERPGQGLRCSVTCEEGSLRDPAPGNYKAVEQRKHDVAAAKDERTCAEVVCDEAEQGQISSLNGKTGDEEYCEEKSGYRSGAARYDLWMMLYGALLRLTKDQPASERA